MITNGDCNLHENQRKAGTLCRSMHCTKCPPYRGPSEIEKLQSVLAEKDREIERLRDALKIASNQLRGVVLLFKSHGTNINLPFLISYYAEQAENARQALVQSEGEG